MQALFGCKICRICIWSFAESYICLAVLVVRGEQHSATSEVVDVMESYADVDTMFSTSDGPGTEEDHTAYSLCSSVVVSETCIALRFYIMRMKFIVIGAIVAAARL